MNKIFMLLCSLMLYGSCLAFPFENVDEVVITEPVHENLYISGGHIIINAPVYADLIVAGGIVQINDSVFRDILCVGGLVTINGYTQGNIRCAGARLHVLKSVKGDLIIVSGNVIVEKEAAIDGLVSLTGGSVIFDGIAKTNFHAKCRNIQFNGLAEKDVFIDCRQLEMTGRISGKTVMVADEITIDSGAYFQDTVTYWIRKGPINFGSAIAAGKVIYDESLSKPYRYWYYLGASTPLNLTWYLGAALLMIAIIVYIFNTAMKKAAAKIADAPLKSLGSGALFFIGVPAAIIFFFVSVFGIPVSLVLLVSYIIVLLLASIITSVVTCNWFNNRFKRKLSYLQLVLFSFFIFLIFKSFTSLTPFGFIIIIIGYCMAFGGIVRSVEWKFKKTNNLN